MRFENVQSGYEDDIELNELMTLVQSQPKAAFVQESKPEVEPLHENFYDRFHGIVHVAEGTGNEDEVFYVRMVKERFGYDLLAFYERNYELCNTLYSLIEQQKAYVIAKAGYEKILREELRGVLLPGTAEKIQSACEHPWGIQAIGAYYWDKINPLLNSAYETITNEFLNAPFLTK